MTTFTLVLRSFRYYSRSHLGALLGAALGTAVLVGALVVGDSVRGSLRDMALARLGKTEAALASNERFFRAALADDIAKSSATDVAPAVELQGTAARTDGSARANGVQVLGVDERFWKLSQKPVSFKSPGPDEVVLNRSLANQLHAQVGETVLLRVAKPSGLSREAALSPQEDFAVPFRLTVRAIAADDEMGRFSLQASQVPPFNAFLSLPWLDRQLQITNRANLLLAASNSNAGGAIPQLTAALRASFQLADAELKLLTLTNGGGLELRSSRVFIDPIISAIATNITTNATGVLTYFVNELRVGNHTTPYSMVTAIGASTNLLPAMNDSEIAITQWLADDLQAKPGDELALSYFVLGGAQRLEERTNQLRIHAVLPMSGLAIDRTLMPEFPGLEKADSTRDWDSSLPIKLDRIRPKDEEYWKKYRGAPKAFVRLAAGQRMWANRFGNLTAVRYAPGSDPQLITAALQKQLDPARLGMAFEPVRSQALAASDQAQDFGQLFLGFSFFLVIAALLLIALLFQFAIEKRATEVGTLLALGFTAKRVRRLLLGEGAVLSCLGALLGLAAGMGYARAMLYGLSTIWRSAVQTSALSYHAQPQTLVIGTVSGILVVLLTLWFALRKQARQPARELLSEGADVERASSLPRKRSRGIWIGWLASALAMLMVGWAGMQRESSNAEVFFLAGTLLLISGVGFSAAFLAALRSVETATRPRLSSLALRNATRRTRRSLAVILLLACGSFLIASIGAFRLDANTQATQRSSGTGGFALTGESTLPIVHDLNTPEGRQFFGLTDQDMAGVRVVALRVHSGDDASCLNLNRAQKPRLLGVRAELLAERHAFTFADTPSDAKTAPWRILERTNSEAIPAVGDAASIEWALGKKVGDTIPYTDEHGIEFKVQIAGALANSILQGSLIIAEPEFVKRFPSESGYRMFLIDVEPNNPAHLRAVMASLSRATQDYGLQLTPTVERLAAFNAVQNTYLSTFQVLGGLGLVLGSIGLGVLLMRNVLERRSELALLLAVGFRPSSLKRLVLTEHLALLALGVFIGVVAALVAVLPSLLSPGAKFPLESLFWTLVAVCVSGVVWTWLATAAAVRGNLLDALRSE